MKDMNWKKQIKIHENQSVLSYLGTAISFYNSNLVLNSILLVINLPQINEWMNTIMNEINND